MTIDEFIKELENKAELEKERAFYDAVKWNSITAYGAYCRKLESEYHQLAEWLKELKAHREAWMKVVSEVDQHTDIHNDSELYVKNFDVKKIIAEYKPKEVESNESSNN